MVFIICWLIGTGGVVVGGGGIRRCHQLVCIGFQADVTFRRAVLQKITKFSKGMFVSNWILMPCQEEETPSEWKLYIYSRNTPVTLLISSVVSGWVFWSTSWMVCFWFWIVPIVWGGLSSEWHVNPWFTLVIIILSVGKVDGPRLEFALSHPF